MYISIPGTEPVRFRGHEIEVNSPPSTWSCGRPQSKPVQSCSRCSEPWWQHWTGTWGAGWWGSCPAWWRREREGLPSSPTLWTPSSPGVKESHDIKVRSMKDLIFCFIRRRATDTRTFTTAALLWEQILICRTVADDGLKFSSFSDWLNNRCIK